MLATLLPSLSGRLPENNKYTLLPLYIFGVAFAYPQTTFSSSPENTTAGETSINYGDMLGSFAKVFYPPRHYVRIFPIFLFFVLHKLFDSTLSIS